MRETFFWVDQQKIAWSFWQKLVTLCRGDKLEAGRVLYRARAKKAKNYMAWIRKGFEMPERYAMKPCEDEYNNGDIVKAWVDKVCFRVDPVKADNAMEAFFEKFNMQKQLSMRM